MEEVQIPDEIVVAPEERAEMAVAPLLPSELPVLQVEAMEEEIAPLIASSTEVIDVSALEESAVESPEWIEAELFSLAEGIPLDSIGDSLEDSIGDSLAESIQEPESYPALIAATQMEELTFSAEEPLSVLNVQDSRYVGEPTLHSDAMSVDLNRAFNGSPIIYTLLLILSIGAVTIWLYLFFSLSRLTKAPKTFSQALQNKLMSNHFDEALSLCQESDNLLSKMIASGIYTRKHGLSAMVDAMKAEGKRSSMHFWQKIGMLNDIAIIAPLLGLLGTVLGMFYAFYHINRSIESISTLFDGLGVSVGTTVAGLIVAILALILHSVAKYRLIRALASVENEAHALAHLIDDKTTLYTRG